MEDSLVWTLKIFELKAHAVGIDNYAVGISTDNGLIWKQGSHGTTA